MTVPTDPASEAPATGSRRTELSSLPPGHDLFGNYRRAPVAFSHGRGSRLWDTEGNAYLDFLAGIAVSTLGHAHPRLVEALREQASRYIHVSNLYRIPEQEEAARQLVKAANPEASATGLARAFFCNSGTEANEAAIKLARRWGSDSPSADGPRFEVVATENSFHGRTLGSLAATGNPAYHRGFEPLPGGFVHVPFNDLAAAAAAITSRTCAILVECVQGEGGVVVGERDYLQGLQGLCRDRGILLILDEVQTGIGRTGEMFGFQHYGLDPDLITLAKGLGGGVAVGAVLAREAIANAFVPGTHGTTFGGNPLACRAVTTVLEVLREEDLLRQVRDRGEQLRRGLRAIGDSTDYVQEVRGIGLMLAAELAVDAAGVVAVCLRRGLLINAVRPDTVRLLPPLVVTEQEVADALVILGSAIEEVGNSG